MKYPNLKEYDNCPYCGVGVMKLKSGRYGDFLGCDSFPRCAFTQKKEEELDIGMAGYKDKYYSK